MATQSAQYLGTNLINPTDPGSAEYTSDRTYHNVDSYTNHTGVMTCGIPNADIVVKIPSSEHSHVVGGNASTQNSLFLNGADCTLTNVNNSVHALNRTDIVNTQQEQI